MRMQTGTLNVLQLALSFLCIFFAFYSQSFIEQTVVSSKADEGKASRHAGYVGLAIVYGVFTLGTLVAAPIVTALSARWALVLGGVLHVFFQGSFLFFHEYLLYLGSVCIGVGAAIIWTAQGNYIALNSTPENAKQHATLFWSVSQICSAGGGVFLFIVFHNAKDTKHVSDATVNIAYGVFTGVTVLAVFLMATLRMPSAPANNDQPRTFVEAVRKQKEVIRTMGRLFCTKQMLLLTVAFGYTGLELSFWSGIFPTCIANSEDLSGNTKVIMAEYEIALGIGMGVTGVFLGLYGNRKFSQSAIIFLGAVLHGLAFVAVFLNFPHRASLEKTTGTGYIGHPSVPLAIVCGFLMGTGDACWNTQVAAFLVAEYRVLSAEAFALFKFWHAATGCAAFFYGTKLELQWHAVILMITNVGGWITFVLATRMAPKQLDLESDGEAKSCSDVCASFDRDELTTTATLAQKLKLPIGIQ